jgi:hypothetical protein
MNFLIAVSKRDLFHGFVNHLEATQFCGRWLNGVNPNMKVVLQAGGNDGIVFRQYFQRHRP